MNPAQTELQAIEELLAQLRQGSSPVAHLCRRARSAQALLAALPERYGQVLNEITDRLESSALFTEESCSFSQGGLLDNLQLWLDKAKTQLAEV